MIESTHVVTHLTAGMSPAGQAEFGVYGRMKAGDRDSLATCARMLVPHVIHGIRATSDPGPWLITSPPVHEIPSAANLLARLVCERVVELDPDQVAERLVLRRGPTGPLFLEEHYGGRDRAARETYLDLTVDGWVPEPRLRGASVVYVNDVRVTGAQEARARRFLERAGVRAVNWHYLYARDEPDSDGAGTFESWLNASGLSTDDEFVELTASADRDLTTKFVWRLLQLDPATFAAATRAMPVESAGHLRAALRAERAPVARLREDQRSFLGAPEQPSVRA